LGAKSTFWGQNRPPGRVPGRSWAGVGTHPAPDRLGTVPEPSQPARAGRAKKPVFGGPGAPPGRGPGPPGPPDLPKKEVKRALLFENGLVVILRQKGPFFGLFLATFLATSPLFWLTFGQKRVFWSKQRKGVPRDVQTKRTPKMPLFLATFGRFCTIFGQKRVFCQKTSKKPVFEKPENTPQKLGMSVLVLSCFGKIGRKSVFDKEVGHSGTK
jgi:hypothetical protein